MDNVIAHNNEDGNTTTPGGYYPVSETTEKSIKSCYAVVYALEQRKWVVAGEGGWSEVHLCQDNSDNSCRILAWTVASQQVLMNCNVVGNCVYKTKSKNFHSFQDENGERFGLGFHKSDSGLIQASEFLLSVTEIISHSKLLANVHKEVLNVHNGVLSKQITIDPPLVDHPSNELPYTSVNNNNNNNGGGGGLPKFQYSESVDIESVSQSQSLPSNMKPKPFSANSVSEKFFFDADVENEEEYIKEIPNTIEIKENEEQYDGMLSVVQPNNNHNSHQLSPVSAALQGFDNNLQSIQSLPSIHNLQPTYHLKVQQIQSLPTQPIGTLGNLKILPPKPQKLKSGDSNIKNPNKVERLWRVTYNKNTGQYSGLPQEWMDALNMQFGIRPKLLPSVKLAAYTSKIPKILIQLYTSLKTRRAFEQVGIFRLAPNASANNAMKEKINKGNIIDEENIDINVCANLIKVWFRDLPEPLLSCVPPLRIEMVSDVNDAVSVLDEFPEPEHSIFLWLCDMCVDIAQYEKINKMSAQNLAIVIGPNLFNTETFENPMKAMTYSQKVVEFFKHCILWRASL